MAVVERPRTAPSPRSTRKVVAAILLAGAAVGIGLPLWTLVLRDRFVVKRFGVVAPGVYRSGQISRFLIEGVIDRYRIGTIIDLNGLEPRIAADQQAEVAVSKSKGVEHHRFKLNGDGTGKIERFADALEVLVHSEQRGTPVLVHCAAGTQRTGTCVAFYRLLIRRDPPRAVYDELLRYGWDPRTDHVLEEYVNGHMHEMAQLLVARHVLDRVPQSIPQLPL